MDNNYRFVTVKILDRVLEFFRNRFGLNFLNKSNSTFLELGNISVLVFMGLFFMGALIKSIWFKSVKLFLSEFVVILLIPIFHYLALKLIVVYDDIVNKTPSEMSKPILDWLAAVHIFTAVISPVLFTIIAFTTDNYIWLFFGPIGAVIGLIWAVFSFTPSSINIKEAEQKSGKEDVLAFLMFFYKAPLKAFPSGFGLFSISASISLFIGIILLIVKSRYTAIFMGGAIGFMGVTLLIPLFLYLYCLFGQLFVGLCKSILHIQDK